MATFQPVSIRQPLAVFLCMVLAIALLWSRALLSIVPAVLAFVAVTDIHVYPLKIKWLLTPERIRELIRSKPQYWVFSLLFAIYLASIVYAGDVNAWWKLTHPKIIFLLLPMAFAFLEPLTKKQYMAIMLSLVLMTVWSSVWVQVAYFENYYLFNRSMGFGGSLPAPTNHIRYSVIVAVCIILCLAFAIEDKKYKYHWERWVYGIFSLYLFYFLHLLSVRTGLVIAYAGVFILVALYLRHLQRWKQFAIIGLLIIAPILAYKTMPSFEHKVHYSLYDLQKFNEGSGEHYSDSERWQSWRAGIEIGNAQPFFGTGPGKYKDALADYYKTNYQRDQFEKPHNQFINVFACFGLFGLFVFLVMLIYPMTTSYFWKEPILPTIYLTQILSMIVEHPLDTELGAALFLLMVLTNMSYQEFRFGSNASSPLSTTPQPSGL